MRMGVTNSCKDYNLCANKINNEVKNIYYYLSKSETDLNGNSVSYLYDKDKLTKITKNDGQSVNVAYSGEDINFVNNLEHKWIFSNSNSSWSIVQPDGLNWIVDFSGPYATGKYGKITSVTSPLGGKSNYEWEWSVGASKIYTACNQDGYLVSKRAGKNLAPAEREIAEIVVNSCMRRFWGEIHQMVLAGLAYDKPVLRKKTTSSGAFWKNEPVQINGTKTVSTNDYDEVSYYYDDKDIPLSTCNENTWKVGLLKSKQIKSKGGQIIQEEVFNWEPREIGKHASSDFQLVIKSKRMGTYGYTCKDSTSKIPVLASRSINRNGATYNTSTNYDELGRPINIVENGQEFIAKSFVYDKDLTKNKWILGAVTNELTILAKPEQSIHMTYMGDGQWSMVGADRIFSIDELPHSMANRVFNKNTGKLEFQNVNGVSTRFTWNAAGDMATKMDANGVSTRFFNYKRGIAQQEIRPVVNGLTISLDRLVDDYGNITSATNGKRQTTSFQYDALNRLTLISPPINNPTKIIYTKDTKTVSRGSDLFVTQVNAEGHPIYSNHNGMVINRRFDELGRNVFESYPNSSLGESMSYDPLGRLIKQTHGDNTFISWNYEPRGMNRIDETNERGFIIQRSYRSFGDPNSKQLIGVVNVAVPAANVSIDRNILNQVTRISQNGRTRSYAYDKHFFLTKRIDPEIGVTTFGRDNLGNMKTRQVGNAGITRYEYDFQSRLKKVVYPNSAPAHYEYDNNNNMLSMAIGSSLRRYTYDANNNLETERVDTGDKWLESKYSYNADDALRSLTYPNGRVVQFAPDAFGRPTRIGDAVPGIWYHPNGVVQAMTYANGVAQTQTLDDRQWIKTIQVGRGGTGGCGGTPTPPANLSNKPEIIRQNDGNYIYVGNGYYDAQLVKLNYAMIPLDDDLIIPVPAIPANALSPAQLAQGLPLAGNSARDINGNLNPTPCNVAAGGTLYANRSYGYDGVGNVKNIRDSIRPEANRDLDYDAIDRLTVANGSWGAGSIAYDGNGNITRQAFAGYNLNYAYDAASQKLSSTSGAQVGSYQYDVYGNVTNRGTGQSYTYDDAGNMAFINKGAANAVAYSYDAKGWRVRSLGANLDSQQVHIGNNLVSEYDNIKKGWLDHLYLGNQKVADWTWDKDGTQKLEFFHSDPAGSPMLATDTAGVVLWAANYYPYGYKLAGGGAGEKNKQWFGGKPQDDESGLQYFGARYYDSVIGRFMAMDPVDWQESNPFHSFNSYAYANNNPWRYVDPDGEEPFTCGPNDYYSGMTFSNFNSAGYSGSWLYGDQRATQLAAIGHEAEEVALGLGVLGIEKVGAKLAKEALLSVLENKAVKEGIYEFKIGVQEYVGQSKNIFNRLTVHIRTGRLKEDSISSVKTTEVLGGKLARETAEQARIYSKTNGAPARNSDSVANKVDPIGPKRRK
jgi:RHS repeat-associated protein